jgi:hypothetical protein
VCLEEIEALVKPSIKRVKQFLSSRVLLALSLLLYSLFPGGGVLKLLRIKSFKK